MDYPYPTPDSDMAQEPTEVMPSQVVRQSVSQLAYSVKKAANEVRSATSNHTHVGRLAEDFLSELVQLEITLLYLYDKSEMGNVSERFITSLHKDEYGIFSI